MTGTVEIDIAWLPAIYCTISGTMITSEDEAPHFSTLSTNYRIGVTHDWGLITPSRVTPLCRVPAKELKNISPNQAAKTLYLIRLQRSERSKLGEVFGLQVHSGTTDFAEIQVQ
eukprot:sb/3476850/